MREELVDKMSEDVKVYFDDILKEKVNEEVNKYLNDPKYIIEVRVKENDEVDDKEGSDYNPLKAAAELEKDENSQNYIKDYEYAPEYNNGTFKTAFGGLKQVKDRVMDLSYNGPTSYYAFHYNVWKNLSMGQKVVSAIMFKRMLEDDLNIDSSPVRINTKFGEALKLAFNEDRTDTVMFINPKALMNSVGYRVMEKMVNLVKYDQVNLLKIKYIMGEKPQKCPLELMANTMNYVKIPEWHYEYEAEEELTDDQYKQMLTYLFQPIEYEKRNSFEKVKEYFRQIHEDFSKLGLNLEDYDFAMEEDDREYEYQRQDTLFEKYFGLDKREKLQKHMFKDKILILKDNYRLNKSINELKEDGKDVKNVLYLEKDESIQNS